MLHGLTRAWVSGGILVDFQVDYSLYPNEYTYFLAYDAYGNPVGFDLAKVMEKTSILYSGEQTDSTGLQYLRARYYDPRTGRFNSLDPYAGNTEDPQSLHKYLYCHANPINGSDPTGEFAQPDQLALGNAAHKIITVYYRIEHLGNWVEGNTKPWPEKPAGRPDITNYTLKTLAEIKPDNQPGIKEGHVQLNRDLYAMNTAEVAHCNTWGPDKWNPRYLKYFAIGLVDPRYKDWYGYIAKNDKGVITYKLFKKEKPLPEPVAVPIETYETQTKNAYQQLKTKVKYEDCFVAAYVAQGAALATLLVGGGLLAAKILATTDLLQQRPSMYQGIAATTTSWAKGFAATSAIFAGMFWDDENNGI